MIRNLKTFSGLENMGRVFEIAYLGQFKVHIVTAPDSGIHDKQVEQWKQIFKNCSDGGDLIASDLFDADIIFEATLPSFGSVINTDRCETIEAVKERATLAIHRTVKATKPDETYKTLLKAAYEKLGLNPYEVDIIERVALTIAQLDGTNTVELQHLAEAIQYRSVEREKLNKLPE
jgi:hypothetical protein